MSIASKRACFALPLASAAVLLLVFTHAAAAHTRSQSRTSLASLPGEAQALISATLGREDAAYHARTVRDELRLLNGRHGLSALFTTRGVEVNAGSTRFALTLEFVGRGQSLAAVPPVSPAASANRIEYRRGIVTEWYVNGPLGLEHGFTVSEKPRGSSATPLTLSLAVTGNASPALERGHDGLKIGSALRYSGLVTTDADGRSMRSWLELRGRRLLVRVDDAGARYPLTIDPWFQQAKLTASDAADHFGIDVAISEDGNTIVAGAESADIGANAAQGAVYVFVKSAGGWANATQTAKLVASDGAAEDLLGESVAISGDTIVAGARNANDNKGAIYVFVKPAGGWVNGTETAKLVASDGLTNENFGLSVAIAGDTVVGGVGAPIVSRPGKLYVFVKPAGGWASGTETATLSVASASVFDLNPGIVAISADGTTITAGSPSTPVNFQGAVYVFVKPAGGWATATQTAKLSASDGGAFHSLGSVTAISADTIVAGATKQGSGTPGAIYVFVKPDGGWANGTETAILTASDGQPLGSSVAVGGGTVAAGAPFANVGSNVNQGIVYVFVKPAGGWTNSTETATLTAADGAEFGHFGISLAMSGESIVVGAVGFSGGSHDAVYVFLPVSAKVDDLSSLLSGLTIPAGLKQSLNSKLAQIKKAVQAGDITTACSLLNAFISEVTAQQGKKKISSADASLLISEANDIRTLIGCL